MTNIKIITSNDEFIEIELANHAGANIWLEHIKNQEKKGTLSSITMPNKLPPNSADYSPIWNCIKKNIIKIEETFNVKWPENIFETSQDSEVSTLPFNRQLLNRFHRYFAQGTIFFNRWQINSLTTFDPISTEKRDLFVKLLEEINVWIHQIEKYCDSINNNEYQGKIKKLDLKFDNLKWRGYSWERFFDHGADPEYNVCLSMEVHGKNYLQAFLDDDDPTQIDVHGIQGMYGCLDIYLDDAVFKILKSKEFKKWLGTGCIKDTGLLQIGKVISSSKPLLNLFSEKINKFELILSE